MPPLLQQVGPMMRRVVRTMRTFYTPPVFFATDGFSSIMPAQLIEHLRPSSIPSAKFKTV